MPSRKAADLESLIRLRKWEVDEAQRVLTALLDREQQLVLYGQELERQLVREGQAYSQNPIESGQTFAAFLVEHKNRRTQLAQNLAILREKIEEARDELAETYRVRRTTEEVRDQRAEREMKEEARVEQIELDEIALNQHRME